MTNDHGLGVWILLAKAIITGTKRWVGIVFWLFGTLGIWEELAKANPCGITL